MSSHKQRSALSYIQSIYQLHLATFDLRLKNLFFDVKIHLLERLEELINRGWIYVLVDERVFSRFESRLASVWATRTTEGVSEVALSALGFSFSFRKLFLHLIQRLLILSLLSPAGTAFASTFLGGTALPAVILDVPDIAEEIVFVDEVVSKFDPRKWVWLYNNWVNNLIDFLLFGILGLLRFGLHHDLLLINRLFQ